MPDFGKEEPEGECGGGRELEDFYPGGWHPFGRTHPYLRAALPENGGPVGWVRWGGTHSRGREEPAGGCGGEREARDFVR